MLQVPLVVFKREKEVSRSLEFDGMWIAEQPGDDDIKGHWDKLVISTGSFPDKYWDKFVKKKVCKRSVVVLVNQFCSQVFVLFIGPQVLNYSADGSRVSIALIRLCDNVILSVCPHDKTKTAETKIAKLDTEIVHHRHDTSPTNEY